MEKVIRTIPLSKLNKRNSNLWRVEGMTELKKALQRVNGKTPKYDDVAEFISYCRMVSCTSSSPFDDVDFRLDMEKFYEGLSESNRRVLELLHDNVPIKLIAEDLDLPVKTVYSKFYKLRDLLYDYFYGEED